VSLNVDGLTDLLMVGTLVVPVLLAFSGLVELAIMALVVCVIGAGLVASTLPDAPFRSMAETPDEDFPGRADGGEH
jgi:hypothetical protein